MLSSPCSLPPTHRLIFPPTYPSSPIHSPTRAYHPHTQLLTHSLTHYRTAPHTLPNPLIHLHPPSPSPNQLLLPTHPKRTAPYPPPPPLPPLPTINLISQVITGPAPSKRWTNYSEFLKRGHYSCSPDYSLVNLIFAVIYVLDFERNSAQGEGGRWGGEEGRVVRDVDNKTNAVNGE